MVCAVVPVAAPAGWVLTCNRGELRFNVSILMGVTDSHWKPRGGWKFWLFE
jgi:hypothetical protein